MMDALAILAVLGIIAGMGYLLLSSADSGGGGTNGTGDAVTLPASSAPDLSNLPTAEFPSLPAVLTPAGWGNMLSASQIYSLARGAGWHVGDAVIATAIALAESSGNPRAYNPETAAGTPEGLGSYGLWQIYRKAHPEFMNVDLYDPSANAAAAYSVWRGAGNSFRPWSTYKNGNYMAWLNEAQSVSA